jgi:hypothetical protein
VGGKNKMSELEQKIEYVLNNVNPDNYWEFLESNRLFNNEDGFKILLNFIYNTSNSVSDRAANMLSMCDAAAAKNIVEILKSDRYTPKLIQVLWAIIMNCEISDYKGILDSIIKENSQKFRKLLLVKSEPELYSEFSHYLEYLPNRICDEVYLLIAYLLPDEYNVLSFKELSYDERDEWIARLSDSFFKEIGYV